MAALLTAAEVEALAKLRGLTVAQLCARAGVAHSTFTRWRGGDTKPGIGVYQRFIDVLDATPPPPPHQQLTGTEAA